MSQSDNFERFARTEAVAGDLKRKSVLGALTTGGGSAADFALRLASTLILARLLIPEHFGLVAMVTAVTRIGERFANLGLSTATVQAPKITHEQCSNLFWINAIAGLTFAMALVVFSPAIASFYRDPRLQLISIAIALNFAWTGFTAQHLALLRRQMKLPQIAGIQVVATFLSICVGIGLALAGFGYWALVWKEVTQSFFIAVGVWTLCRWIPGPPSRRVKMRRLLTFGRDMTLTQLLLAVSAQLDSLLIGRFGGAVSLGLFRQAHNLMMAPVERLRAPIYSVSQPGLSILQNEPARYRRYYQRILFIVSLATIPLGLFTTIYASEIVLVALGEKWLGAVVFLQIFGIAAAVQPALGTTGIVMITCGKSGRYFWVSLVYNAVLLVVMFAGVQWGAVGIASARVATLLLLMPWALYYSFAGTPVSVGDFVRSVSKPFAAGAAMAVMLGLLRHLAPLDGGPIALAAGCATAVGAYLLALNLLPGGRRQLQSLAKELITGLRKRSTVGAGPGSNVT